MVCRRPRVQQASGDEEDVPVEVAQQLEKPGFWYCQNKRLLLKSCAWCAFLNVDALTKQVIGDDWPQQPPEKSFGSLSARLQNEDVQRIVVTDLKNFKGVYDTSQTVRICHDGCQMNST